MADPSVSYRSDVDTRALRRDLENVQKGLGKLIGKTLKDAVAPIVQDAKRLAPYDPDHAAGRKDKLGHIRDSIKPGTATPKGVTVVSTHPAAKVFEWNDGVRPAIAPNGVPLTIKSVQMAHRAAEQRLPEFERSVADGMAALIAQYGL